jgi:PmbA protein
MPIVINPKATATIIAGALSVPLNADYVQRSRSYLCEKLNEEIGCNQLTVIDDGTLSRGLLSTKFDAEGTPSQRTILVENGVLKNYMHDSYTAGVENRESTGNCLRSGNNIGFGDYRVSPYISTRNLIIADGKRSEEDMISEVKEGIWLCDTADVPNFSTGEFSGLMAEAYKIENGEIAYPIKQATIGMNMLDFFKDIDAVGTDKKQLVTSGVDGLPKSVTASTIRIKAARVAG